jgi:ubiquinone/menaquinone biosynthesis C-methylase UbiE
MEEYQFLIDLHKRSKRQGPGGDVETEKAIDLAMLDSSASLRIADIGCGTGASTLSLARLLDVRITAVDFLQDFLDVLEGRAKRMGLFDKVTTLCCSMDNLPFGDEEYDVIWSEGAIYNLQLWCLYCQKISLVVIGGKVEG